MAKQFTPSQFADYLKKASDNFIQEVKDIVELNVGDMELEAIRNAPGPSDQVRVVGGTENEADIRQSKSAKNGYPISQSIGYTIDPSGLKGSVFVERSAGPFAIWIEFGTGQSAASYVPTLPAELQAVAKAYYINGKGTVINQPYLYPAYLKQKEQFFRDLKEAINKFGK